MMSTTKLEYYPFSVIELPDGFEEAVVEILGDRPEIRNCFNGKEDCFAFSSELHQMLMSGPDFSFAQVTAALARVEYVGLDDDENSVSISASENYALVMKEFQRFEKTQLLYEQFIKLKIAVEEIRVAERMEELRLVLDDKNPPIAQPGRGPE